MRKTLLICLSFLLYFAATAQTDTTLNEYKGIYKFPDGSATPSVEITIQGNELYANSSIGSASMTKIAKDTFSIPSYGGMAYFTRNEAGKIKGIRVEVGDLILIGDKEVNMPMAYRRQRVLVSK
jgi:hypothetical protein